MILLDSEFLFDNDQSLPDHALIIPKRHGFIDVHTSRFGILANFGNSIKYKLNNYSFSLPKQKFLVVAPENFISIEPGINNQYLLLYFDDQFSQLLLNKLFETNTKINHDYHFIEYLHDTQDIIDQLSLLDQLKNSCASFQNLKSDSIIRNILEYLLNESITASTIGQQITAAKKITRVELYKSLAQAKNYIDKHYMNSLSIELIATNFSMNKFHFLRQFKKTYNITPHQYIREVRLKEASKN